jgi:hypothetical protein
MTPNMFILLFYVLPAILLVTLSCMASKSVTVADFIKYLFCGIVPIGNIIILLVTAIIIVSDRLSEKPEVQTFLNKKLK